MCKIASEIIDFKHNQCILGIDRRVTMAFQFSLNDFSEIAKQIENFQNNIKIIAGIQKVLRNTHYLSIGTENILHVLKVSTIHL